MAISLGNIASVTGPLSGDLTGTLPSPTVAKVASITPGAANGVATLNGSSAVVQDPASKGVASGLATLNGSSQVVQDPASKGQASGLATLNGASLVAQNPASATATPTATSIPLADGAGKLAAGWIPGLFANATISPITLATPTTIATLTCPSGTSAQALLGVAVQATDGTDLSSFVFELDVNITNQAGTFSFNNFEQSGPPRNTNAGKTIAVAVTNNNTNANGNGGPNQNTIQITVTASGWSPTVAAIVRVLFATGTISTP